MKYLTPDNNKLTLYYQIIIIQDKFGCNIYAQGQSIKENII
jgi:hypothetical protein